MNNDVLMKLGELGRLKAAKQGTALNFWATALVLVQVLVLLVAFHATVTRDAWRLFGGALLICVAGAAWHLLTWRQQHRRCLALADELRPFLPTRDAKD